MLKMIKKISLGSIFFTIFLFPNFSDANELSEKTIDEMIRRGIRATILQQYEQAISIFDSLRIFATDDPRPDFYHAAALQSKMMDLESYEDEADFFSFIDKVLSSAENQIKKNPEKASGYFFKGGAFSYRGYYYAKKKEYARGLRDSITAVKYLSKAIAIDSTLYDAYLGIGFYKYWRGRLTQFVNWLPFVEDQSEEGLEMIHKAIEKGRYSRAAAINGLIWLDIDEENYGKAIQTSLRMLDEYPGSRFFLWPLAEAYYKDGNYDEAIATFRNLQLSYQHEENHNHYNEMICGYKMMKAYGKLNKPQEMCEISNRLLEVSPDESVRKRLKDKLKEINQINEACSKMP